LHEVIAMCFSIDVLKNFLIWIVVVFVVVGIVRYLLVPRVIAPMGEAGVTITKIINLVVWAFMAIVLIYVCFGLLECLLGSGGYTRLR
jgi:hypothetical protein